MYKKPCEQLYHIFTDENDEYTSDFKEAMSIARQWYREYGTIRVYLLKEYDEVEGIWVEESGDCILSKGSFPL